MGADSSATACERHLWRRWGNWDAGNSDGVVAGPNARCEHCKEVKRFTWGQWKNLSEEDKIEILTVADLFEIHSLADGVCLADLLAVAGIEPRSVLYGQAVMPRAIAKKALTDCIVEIKLSPGEMNIINSFLVTYSEQISPPGSL